MAKAMLVMDMPRSCTKCDFIYREMCCCGLILIQTAAIESTEGYTKCRPSWCPLREVPEKKDTTSIHPELHEVDVRLGYNKCIDEILGKEV